MAKDLEIIKRLEKKYGTKLFDLEIGDIENYIQMESDMPWMKMKISSG